MRPRDLHPPRGFTLLEVLMVVLLVGIMSSVVVLSLGTAGAQRELPEEGARLAALMEEAAGEAVMQNQEYGLRLTGSGYAFLCLNEAKQRWAPCAEEAFRERELAGGLELRLVSQGGIKALPVLDLKGDVAASTAARQRDEEEGAAAPLTPDLYFLSSGETSAATLELRVEESPEQRSEIRIDEVGRVTLEGAGAPGETRVEDADDGPA